MRIDGRKLTFAVLALALGALCVWLGFWQLDRLSERRAGNEQRAERLALPPVELAPDPVSGAAPAVPPADSLLWRRVVLRGHWDFGNELVVRNRSHGGVPGVHVVTPLLLGDEEAPEDGPAAAILVRRGWLPATDGLRASLTEGRPPQDENADVGPGPAAAVEGIVLPPEPGLEETAPPRYQLDGGEHAALVRLEPEAVSGAIPYRVDAFFVHATDPGPAGPALRLLPPPELDEGPHLLYAIQWFSFAAIALVGTLFWLRHER